MNVGSFHRDILIGFDLICLCLLLGSKSTCLLFLNPREQNRLPSDNYSDLG